MPQRCPPTRPPLLIPQVMQHPQPAQGLSQRHGAPHRLAAALRAEQRHEQVLGQLLGADLVHAVARLHELVHPLPERIEPGREAIGLGAQLGRAAGQQQAHEAVKLVAEQTRAARMAAGEQWAHRQGSKEEALAKAGAAGPSKELCHIALYG